ncbi:Iron-sulfur cluster carrier protein [Burkholderia lata]|uniref:nucleotide-binding protein n=1 Tax=Burkholderia lata (strain ATCC 17760 / DSM 23089 / LMG 22485 / NCIMB 9086 / R18194 / 383) TaxID=482957 RepID=UPI001452EC00|nr:P-loop NTPase [Burkholderia lata]VWC37706.1 Iron-sulfur cluster carrier protein [Burkholderia lata]
MSKHIYLVGGSKGGVGKSMVTMALIDYLQGNGESVVLIETDTSNPDVWKTYGESTKGELVNLEDADGWIKLINICGDEDNKESTIVINTRAANNQGVQKYGETLNSTLEELGRTLIALWVINRQRDSLELLKDFREALPNALVHVVRNGYFGEESKYQLYNGSKIRTAVEENGGKSLTFPDMADLLADDIYTKRLTIAKASADLPIGNRAELKRWKALANVMFDEVAKS